MRKPATAPPPTAASPRGTAERTPDGRYLIVRGRLWRASNPALSPAEWEGHVSALMRARRDVRAALQTGNAEALRDARARVQQAKVGLGERGPVWWTDGTPDLNRRLARNTPYAAWWASQRTALQ